MRICRSQKALLPSCSAHEHLGFNMLQLNREVIQDPLGLLQRRTRASRLVTRALRVLVLLRELPLSAGQLCGYISAMQVSVD
jgi:hypothetical protein